MQGGVLQRAQSRAAGQFNRPANRRLGRWTLLRVLSSKSWSDHPKSEVEGSVEVVGYSACSKRPLLLAAPLLAASIITPARAVGLKSTSWSSPCQLTFLNDTSTLLKVYWLNYDGDPEFFTTLTPGGSWTVNCYKTHPFRLVSAVSQEVIQEVVATEASQTVHVTSGPQPAPEGLQEDLKGEEVPLKRNSTEPSAEYVGFDGLGGEEGDYLPAVLDHVHVFGPVAIASLSLEGLPATLDIGVGLLEGMAMMHAAGLEMRRPSTVGTWATTLVASGSTVERVLITRMAGTTFYSRIVLVLPNGAHVSIDSRPSDSLALALQSQSPIFVKKAVAEVQQEYVRAMEEQGSGALDLDLEDDEEDEQGGEPGAPPPPSSLIPGVPQPAWPGLRLEDGQEA